MTDGVSAEFGAPQLKRPPDPVTFTAPLGHAVDGVGVPEFAHPYVPPSAGMYRRLPSMAMKLSGPNPAAAAEVEGVMTLTLTTAAAIVAEATAPRMAMDASR